MSRKRQKNSHVRLLSCVLLYLCCAALFVACGGVPANPVHPLSDATDTPVDGSTESTTPLAAVDTHIQPIQITSDTAGLTGYPGGQMSMTILTSPSANCTFVVNYGKTTPSAGVGIMPRSADSHGSVTWTWQVDGDAHTGTWPLTIYATLAGGAKTSTQVNVTVTAPPIAVVNAQTNLSAVPKGSMMLTISTAPHVLCVLALNFGPSKPLKYLKTSADGNGIASWTWNVEAKAAVGTFAQAITVTLADGETTSSSVNITVL